MLINAKWHLYVFFQSGLEDPYHRPKTMNLKLEFKTVVGRWGRYFRQGICGTLKI